MIYPACIDFETFGIGPRPESYPPTPVGVAYQTPAGGRPQYLAWGHPTKNNCTFAEARSVLRGLYADYPILCHNAAFDLEVAHEHFRLPLVPRHGFHDTLLLAFLHDPNAEKIGLKDLAVEHLDMPPEEQTKLKEWIQATIPGAKRLKRNWAKHICKAPGTLVGRYAKGDVTRTLRLFRHFRHLHEHPAYARERALLPVLVYMSRRGVPVDETLLDAEIEATEKGLTGTERWIRRKLKLPASQSLDERAAVADAMEKERLLTEWVLTDTGEPSLATDALKLTDCDPRFIGAMELRSLLVWNLRTHLRPWRDQAAFTGGFIHCGWNQVRQAKERQYGRAYGARTGRLSSNPNFQNISKREPELVLPKALTQVSLPDPRRVVAAWRGRRLLGADYSGQELRILAHFAGGKLRQSYIDDPTFDLHGLTQKTIENVTGIALSRTHTKNTVFGRLYGSGIAKTAMQIGTDYGTAKRIRHGLDTAIPELKQLDFKLRKQKGCLTWGERWNQVEMPVFQGDDWRTFDYKLINTLIQGSAADVTKEAMIRYAKDKDREGDLVLSVHDELIAVARTKDAKRELVRLRKHMESVEMDGIAMPTEGSTGKTWRDCR